MLKEILTAMKNSNVDTANETSKFEVGKTYYAADFAGEWSEDAPVIVKTLKVIKRTAKTFTAIDENGNQVLKRISLAYAGTKEAVVVSGVNDISTQTVHIYSDKEYTPAVAAAPTEHFNAWLEAITNGETAEETDEISEDDDTEEYTEDELVAGIEDAKETIATHEDTVTVATAKYNIALSVLDLAKKEQKKADRALDKLPYGVDEATNAAAVARCDAADKAVAEAEAAVKAAKQELDAAYEAAAAIREARYQAERKAEREALGAELTDIIWDGAITYAEAVEAAAEAEIELANIALVDEYVVNADAFQTAITAEIRNANFASGNYSITINGEYVSFKNHSIVRIDATRERQMYLEKDCKGRNRFYVFNPGHGQNHDGADDSATRISARAVAERYMAQEAANEQGKKFAAFFAPYRTSGAHEFTVMVYLTYVDGREHIFSGKFNQYRQVQQFISDVKAFAGDTPCQFFTKNRDHSKDSKPVWEDPHNYETAGCLDHARNIYPADANDEPAPETEIVETADTEETFDNPAVAAVKEYDAAMDALDAAKDVERKAYKKWNSLPLGVDIETNTQLANEWIAADEALVAARKAVKAADDAINAAIVGETVNAGDNNYDAPTEPAPVEDRNLTRRESLELDKKVVMEELDEYREGLLDAEADTDIPQSHIDFLNRSIERLLNEYNDICKQLDELDDEPKPAPVKLPSELPPVDTERITVATVQDARNIISQRFSGNFIPGEVCECWDGTTTAVYSDDEHRLEVFSVDGSVINFAVKNIGDPRPFLQIDIDAANNTEPPAPVVNDPIVGTEITTAFESDYGYRNYDVNGESVKFYYGESPTATAMLITSTQYGAQLYRKDTGNIEFLARPNRSDNGYTGEEQILDADEFFKVMAERGACTIDQPTLPKPGSPCAIANGLNDIFNDTVRGIGYMELTTQGGAKLVTNFGAAYISVDWSAVDGYVFGNHYDDVLARYETAQQVIDVMTALRDAIKRGDTEFAFPPAEMLAPVEPAAVEDERDVFSLLPKLEDLNDVEDESDYDAAEYTDRDDRYNRGEKIAADLTAKLRPFDPTVEVTYTINEYDEDTYYLSYDGIVRTPFAVDGVESSFHAWKKAEAEIEADPWFKARRLESRLAECKSAELKVRQKLNDACDRYDDDELIDEPAIVPEAADTFAAKLAAFDADVARAETDRDAAKAAYDKADADARNAVAARQDFLESIAGDLTRKLHETCVGNDFIETATVSGCPVTIGDFDNVYIDATISGRFVFVTWNNCSLAHYDTPAQVEAVIAQIKGVIERREPVLYFPTVGELERKVKLEDSLARAMKTALEHYKGFCYTGNLTKAEYELKLYNICRKATHELKGSLK